MDYTRLINKENAFSSFLTQQIRKKEITIYYYRIRNNRGRYDDFSYVGYKTNDDGIFGIHYDKRKNSFWFGTRNKYKAPSLMYLFYNLEQEIPPYLKTVLLNVASSGRTITMARPESQNTGI